MWEEKIGLMAVAGVCLGLSFLFSGMEAGVFALSRFRVRQQMRIGNRKAELLHRYLENPENFLWTILTGNTLCSFTGLSIIIIELHRMVSGNPWQFSILFFTAAFLYYALFDLLPKMLFQTYPNRLCLLMAAPFRLIHLALAPLVSVLASIANLLLRVTGGKNFTGRLFGSRGELRQIMQETENTLSSDERVMINRVLDLQNATVQSVMVPMRRAVTISSEAPGAELVTLCREKSLTRIPVWQGNGEARKIVGVASLKHLLYSNEFDAGQPVGRRITPALYLREDLKLEEALRRMQRSGQRLAIVLGLNQREVGIVSLQDILKSIFGEVTL